MKPLLLIGVAMIVGGVAMIVTGMQASNSLVDQLSDTFLGHFTHHTTMFIVGGIALAVGGAVVAFIGANSSKT